MRYSSLLLVCLLITAFCVISAPESVAQQRTYFKLQPHKVQWAQQVMKEAIQKKDSLLLAEAYFLFGKIYEAAGDFKTATDFFLKSLRIQEKRGDSFELVRLYSYLYGISALTYNYSNAKRYSNLAVNTAKRVGTHKTLLRAYGTLISMYSMDWTLGQKNSKALKPNYDSLFYILQKTQEIAQKSGDEMEIVAINQGLGGELLRRNDPKALSHLIKAVELSKKSRKPRAEYDCLIHLASAYIKLGSPDKGYQILNEAKKLRKTLPAHQDVFKNNNTLESIYAQYYKAKKNWRKALEHSEKWFELEKNKYLADREGALSRLSFEHEMEKKDIQLEAQQKELATNTANLLIQRRFIAVIFVLLLISVGIGVAFFRLSRKNQRISERNAQLIQEQNHRVKNNLQVVSSLLSLHSNRLTDEQARQAVSESQLRVETMAILHRKLYDGDKLIVVNMRDFLQEVVNGVLLTYGFAKVETTFDVDALELKPSHALSVGLIVNELSTNACKYAFTENDDPSISISCKAGNNKINIMFTDNGPGFDFEKYKNNKSFGLKLILMQVAQLYGTCEFRNENGTVFQMQFNSVNKPIYA